MKVRAASMEDAEAIAHVQVRSWRCAYREYMPEATLRQVTASQRAKHWRSRIGQPKHRVWLASREGRILGFLSLLPTRDPQPSPSVAEIAALYVDPGAWRRGAGRALVASALSAAAKSGYAELTLWVLATNNGARAFYERMGFAPDGTSQGEPRGGLALRELRYRRSTKG